MARPTLSLPTMMWAVSLVSIAFMAPSVATSSKLEAGFGRAALKRAQALEREWSEELDDQPLVEKVATYKSPIKRVVDLLRRMKSELDGEADRDSKLYDKMACWCQTNDKDKEKIIEEAEQKDTDLTAELESRSAKYGELSSKIDQSKKEVEHESNALKTAAAIREKEASLFSGTAKDLAQNIINCKNAIAVLEKHSGEASLMQAGSPLLSSMRTVLRDLSLKHELLMVRAGGQKDTQMDTSMLQFSKMQDSQQNGALLEALDIRSADVSTGLAMHFAQEELQRAARSLLKPQRAFLQTGDEQPYQSYASQSGTVLGVLRQLLADFESVKIWSEHTEAQAKEDYTALAGAKSEQVAALKVKLDELETEHSRNQIAKSDAMENLKNAREERAEAIEFQRNLKESCQDLDLQWQERHKTRSQEILAVADAIKMLTEDDARELLKSSVTLLQVHAGRKEGSMMHTKRSRAADSLRKAARGLSFADDDLLADWHNRHHERPTKFVSHTNVEDTAKSGGFNGPRAQLSALATAVRLDSFTKVKELMDKMIANLKNQAAEEVKFKAYCINEFAKNEKTTHNANVKKEDLEADIADLEKSIEASSTAMAEAKVQIAETELAIKKASETRENENHDFQMTVADQSATQEILTKVLLRLQEFYKKAPGLALLQRSSQTPPKKFSEYKAHEGSLSVIALLESIVEDSKKLVLQAKAEESKSQADYESFVKASNEEIAGLNASVTSKTKMKAQAVYDKSGKSDDLELTTEELDSLSKYEADLHDQCDFVMHNFDVRQQARLKEQEAIQSAKAILSGAK